MEIEVKLRLPPAAAALLRENLFFDTTASSLAAAALLLDNYPVFVRVRDLIGDDEECETRRARAEFLLWQMTLHGQDGQPSTEIKKQLLTVTANLSK
ncbi:hypothetical protein AKJ16_DCAP04363 [Drosera capensis]